MLLSEILGVERDTDFGVEGYESFRFNINTTPKGVDRLYFKHNDGCWIFAKAEMLTDIIYGAPGNIIHLPTPLTDEQREQLKAIWTLGGRWLAKDFDGVVNYYTHKPHKESEWWYIAKNDDGRYGHRIPLSSAVCKLQELDKKDEPYDIGKALGVEE